MNILVILMTVLILLAIVMFVLFYVYLKKHYNEKHLSDDFEEDDDDEIELVNIKIDNVDYVMNANGYYVKRNEKIQVIFNNEIKDAIVTRENYVRQLNSLNIIPEKLIINGRSNMLIDDIVPIRKNNTL